MRGRQYLLDTHLVFWHFIERLNFSKKLREELEDGNNQLFVSYLSLLEIDLKHKKGLLRLKIPFADIVRDFEKRFGVTLLGLSLKQLALFDIMKFHSDHKDPFDRLFVAQAIAENLCLISADIK